MGAEDFIERGGCEKSGVILVIQPAAREINAKLVLLVYCCGSRMILTKNVPALQPTLHRQDNSPLQPAPVGGNAAHCEHPVSPIDRETERLPQILHMIRLMMDHCPLPLLVRLHDRVSSSAPVPQHIVVVAS
jgi:hypothetical protein